VSAGPATGSHGGGSPSAGDRATGPIGTVPTSGASPDAPRPIHGPPTDALRPLPRMPVDPLSPVDLVVVTYVGDLVNLEVLLHSVSRFGGHAFARVHVIAQAERDAAQLVPTIRSISAGSACPVTVIPQDTLAPGLVSDDGWVVQQILKLMAARLVETPYYLLLDSKNHFVNPITVSDFFRDGRPTVFIADHSARSDAVMQDYFRSTFLYFALDPDEHLRHSARPITPFPIRTDVARALLSDIEAREGRSFPEAFFRRRLSEFFLYTAYIVHRWGSLEAIHAHDPRLGTRIITLWGRELAVNQDYFDSCMDDRRLDQALTFAIHKTARPCLSPAQRIRIAHMWQDRGIVPFAQGQRILGLPA